MKKYFSVQTCLVLMSRRRALSLKSVFEKKNKVFNKF